MRGYKVTDFKRSRIVGIACDTLKQLKEKGCKKLQLNAKKIAVQLQDGTFVDDEEYFKTIPPQTIFLLVQPGEHALTGSEIIYNALCAIHGDYLKAGKLASEFFTQNLKQKVYELANIVNKEENKDRAKLSNRIDDPEWFEGLDTNCTTKEDFMKRRSQERVRGYLYKSQQDLKHSEIYTTNPAARGKIDSTISTLKKWLSAYNGFGCYFDRRMAEESEVLKRSYCDQEGQFKCQGQWNMEACSHVRSEVEDTRPSAHVINPYESRATRIIFSTWNLDHRVERSRRIGPALLQAAAVAAEREEEVNADYFFYLLFTPYNLKLVHIVCHDKGEHHTALCNREQLTIKNGVTSKTCGHKQLSESCVPTFNAFVGLAK